MSDVIGVVLIAVCGIGIFACIIGLFLLRYGKEIVDKVRIDTYGNPDNGWYL